MSVLAWCSPVPSRRPPIQAWPGCLSVSRPTVAMWRRRFALHRLEGLVDAPRAGAPRRIDDQAVERRIALTWEEMPGRRCRPTAPVLPLRPGQPERHTHDCRRCGTTDLFAALDIQAGTVISRCQRRHRSIEFRAFLDTIEACLPVDVDVHVVLDDAAIHKTRIVQDWLVKRPRFHLHFTPTSASPRQPPGCRSFRKWIVRQQTNDGSTSSNAGSPC
jgi:hypothetical protein